MIKIINRLFRGHERTVRAKKNIYASLIIKGISIIIGFLMIRVTLNYLDQTSYGIWLTVASFLTWFTFFEIGLGSGLQNKLAEALALKDYKLAKIYVSSTYAILTVIIFIVAVIFFIANFFIDWTIILNTDSDMLKELTSMTFIVFGFFFLTFVIKLISIVLTADQRSAIANSFGPIGNLIALICIYILTKTTEGSLIYIAWVLSIAPVLVLIGASFYFYRGRYRKIAPSLKYIDLTSAKGLLNLGAKFFFIQISTLILFQSSNIIIAQFFGPSEVTPYNIAYKLFSVILMLFTIIISPFRSAFTEAWVIKDIIWIKKTITNLLYVWVGMFFLAIFLFLISDFFFDFWIGEEKMKSMVISNKLKLSLLISFLLLTFGGIFNMFINGVGKVSVQMYAHVIGAILFLPISFFFIKYLHWGLESVVIATTISFFYYPIIAPYHYYKLIKNKANGIWDK